MLGRVDRVHCTAKRGGYIAGELSSGGGRLPRADYGQAGFGG